MDIRAENRGRPHQKVRFPAAPVVGRNFLTPGQPGVRVRNVRTKSGPKSLCLCCLNLFFFPVLEEVELGPSHSDDFLPHTSTVGQILGFEMYRSRGTLMAATVL